MHSIKRLITIGIPTYNGGANFSDLFLSIQKLGLKDDEYEILVVDNCSTDETEDIIKQAQTNYRNLRFYKNPINIGRVENWNKVIELTKGDYLIIMNVNDRFVEFDVTKYIKYLEANKNIPVLLTDVQFADHIYPNWMEEGLVDLNKYLKKTLLETEYLEFHSLGIFQQHIFRTKSISDHHIRFDPKIPRTTDRVFTAEVIKAGGSTFYYTPHSMVSWHLNPNRYHYNVHIDSKDFNFEELWVNEYKANLTTAKLGNISLKQILISQLIYASFNMQIKRLRWLKDKILQSDTPTLGMEIPTSSIFFAYLKVIAEVNDISINYASVKIIALKRAINWYLRSLNLRKKNIRTLKGIIQEVKIV